MERKQITMKDVKLPQSVKENWEDCPHALANKVKKNTPPKKKTNIGL